jgi:hypothetical protein
VVNSVASFPTTEKNTTTRRLRDEAKGKDLDAAKVGQGGTLHPSGSEGAVV